MSNPTGFQQGGLNGYYFNDIHSKPTWGTAARQTVDSQINFDWGYGGAASGAVGADNFGASWQGKIQAIKSGWTNFFTTADDGVQLKVNGQTVINQWRDQAATEFSGGLNLQAGQFYDIELTYYERGGSAVMKLGWDSAGSKQTISANNLFYDRAVAAGAGINLPSAAPAAPAVASNYINYKSNGFDHRYGFITSVSDLTRSQSYATGVTKALDFNFINGSAVVNAPLDNFAVTASGRVSVQQTGWYNFFVTADDSVNVTLGGNTIANNTGVRGVTTYQSGMWMEAGKSYFMGANYQDLGGSASFEVEWQGQDTGWQRTTLTDRNVLTLSDRLGVNVSSTNMFAAYDQTGGGDMTRLRQLYPAYF